MSNSANREIEARFLEIDVPKLTAALKKLGAEDKGEQLIRETIFYGYGLSWEAGRFLRVRDTGEAITVSYKNKIADTVDGTEEIELTVDSFEGAEQLFTALGFDLARRQEKKRHTFTIDGVSIEIDTWPKVPTFVELEGESEGALKSAAKKLDLEWSKANLESAGRVIEDHYKVPVSTYKKYTFKEIV